MRFDINKNMEFNINGRPATEKDKDKIIKIVKIVTKLFSLLAILLAIAAVVCFVLHYKNSNREYQIVEGTIIDFDERLSSSSSGSSRRRHRSSSRTYAPVFTFEYNGQTFTNTHSVSSSSYGGKRSMYQIGTIVHVRMYGDNPRKTSIDDGFADKISLIIGGVLSFMAIIFFVVSQSVKKVIFSNINKIENKNEDEDITTTYNK